MLADGPLLEGDASLPDGVCAAEIGFDWGALCGDRVGSSDGSGCGWLQFISLE